jgi:hypothetical protein
MIFKYHGQQAAVSIGEYILTFTLVLAFIAGISTYFQRSLQARMRDGRHYLATNLREQCVNTNCVGRGDIGEGYEPYYTQVNSEILSNRVAHRGVAGEVFIARSKLDNQSESQSEQLPPKNAVNDRVLGGQ